MFPGLNAPESGLRLSNRHVNGRLSAFNRRHQMSAGNRSPRPLSTIAFLSLAKTKIRQGIVLTPTLLLASFSLALETPPTTPQTSPQGALPSAKPATDTTTVTVAAGS